MPSLRSLQGRLLAWVLGGVVAVWLGAVALTWFDAAHELDELLDGHLAQAAALLVVQQVQEIEESAHGIDAPSLHRYAPRVAFQVFHEGQLALRSANAPAWPLGEGAQRLQAGFRTLVVDGVSWRVFAAHGAERDVQVFVGEQLSSRSSILRAVLRSTLWPLAVALPLLALAIGWAVVRGMAPLRQLGRTLSARQPQALQPVAIDGAPSEMVPMVTALNALFERIAGLMESERRFTADAAHELRTPIAAIRAQAQVALGESDAGLRRHALEATLEACDRASRLVEQLLTLARMEAGAVPALLPIDLAVLVRKVMADLAPAALGRQQMLTLDAPAPCEVQGDPTLLAVLVRNLVDNAIRYSPPQASVRVGVARRAEGAVLSVDDSGPGLSDADRQRLGERFFRVLGSGQGGSGLGWSIVQRIAAVHGAQLRVGPSAALGGLSVEMAWPA